MPDLSRLERGKTTGEPRGARLGPQPNSAAPGALPSGRHGRVKRHTSDARAGAWSWAINIPHWCAWQWCPAGYGLLLHRLYQPSPLRSVLYRAIFRVASSSHPLDTLTSGEPHSLWCIVCGHRCFFHECTSSFYRFSAAVSVMLWFPAGWPLEPFGVGAPENQMFFCRIVPFL